MSRSIFFLELGAVILGLALLARVAIRLRLSPIPLYLLAGLAFGEGGLLPLLTTKDFIEVGAEIGVLLLLFMLGLEFSADDLGPALRSSLPAGAVDLVLNFLPGVVAGLLLGWQPLAAVFLGGVTYISSSGIVAKLLDELEWVGNRETPVVLAILVIEDLSMAAYLPLLAALLGGGGPVTVVVTLAVALTTAGLVLLGALRFGRHASRIVFSRSDEALLLSILGATLLVAGVAERAQVSAAVGAFLVGIAVSGPAANRAKSLLGPLRDLFAAVFFVFFGLRIDPVSMLPSLGAAAGLAAAGALGKLLTGWWSAGYAGVGTRGRARAGAVLLARGEFSLAIASLGVAAGLEPDLGPLTASFVMILALAGPLASRWSDAVGGALIARRRAATPADEGSSGDPGSGPSAPKTPPP